MSTKSSCYLLQERAFHVVCQFRESLKRGIDDRTFIWDSGLPAQDLFYSMLYLERSDVLGVDIIQGEGGNSLHSYSWLRSYYAPASYAHTPQHPGNKIRK